ncbi:hypothetical protein TGVAND_288250 [Toxoplasma gondii VAND]|uniref:Uncharacterized protein n=1 Tax=Toxoplasma gondii VAND TaxID=933077 RepID=A0A086Q824_TOXGO|nr:hypothetical protein TGVAND_288250 [Toxoplasma gondii VAND]
MVADGILPRANSRSRAPSETQSAVAHAPPPQPSLGCTYNTPFSPEWCLRRGVAPLPSGERSGPPDTVMFKLLPPPRTTVESTQKARSQRTGGQKRRPLSRDSPCNRLFPFMFRDLHSHEERQEILQRLTQNARREETDAVKMCALSLASAGGSGAADRDRNGEAPGTSTGEGDAAAKATKRIKTTAVVPRADAETNAPATSGQRPEAATQEVAYNVRQGSSAASACKEEDSGEAGADDAARRSEAGGGTQNGASCRDTGRKKFVAPAAMSASSSSSSACNGPSSPGVLYSFGFQCFAVNKAGDTLAAGCTDTVHLYHMATKTLHVSLQLPSPPSHACVCSEAACAAPELRCGSPESSRSPSLLAIRSLQFFDEDRLLLALTECGHLYVYFLQHEPEPALLAYVNLREVYEHAAGRLHFLSGEARETEDQVAACSGAVNKAETTGEEPSRPVGSKAASEETTEPGNLVSSVGVTAVEPLEVRYPPAILTASHRSTDAWRLSCAAAAVAALRSEGSPRTAESRPDAGTESPDVAACGPLPVAVPDGMRAIPTSSGHLVLLVSYTPEKDVGADGADVLTRKRNCLRAYTAPLVLHFELRPSLLLLRSLDIQRCRRKKLLASPETTPPSPQCTQLPCASASSVSSASSASPVVPLAGENSLARNLLAGLPLRLLPSPFPCCRAKIVWNSTFTLLDDSRTGRSQAAGKTTGEGAPLGLVSSRLECRFPFCLFRVVVPPEGSSEAQDEAEKPPSIQSAHQSSGLPSSLPDTALSRTLVPRACVSDRLVSSTSESAAGTETETKPPGGISAVAASSASVEALETGLSSVNAVTERGDATHDLAAAGDVEVEMEEATAANELRKNIETARAASSVQTPEQTGPQKAPGPVGRLIALVAVCCPDGTLVLVDWRQRREQVFALRRGTAKPLEAGKTPGARIIWGATVVGMSAASAREVSVRDDGEVLLLRCPDRLVVARLVFPWSCSSRERQTLLRVHRDQQREQRQQFALHLQKQLLLLQQRGEARCARGRGRGRGRGCLAFRSRWLKKRGEDEEQLPDSDSEAETENKKPEGNDLDDEPPNAREGGEEAEKRTGVEAEGEQKEEKKEEKKERMKEGGTRSKGDGGDMQDVSDLERTGDREAKEMTGTRDEQMSEAGDKGVEDVHAIVSGVEHSEIKDEEKEEDVQKETLAVQGFAEREHPFSGETRTEGASGRPTENGATSGLAGPSETPVSAESCGRKACLSSDGSDSESADDDAEDDAGTLIIIQFIHMDCVQKESYTALSPASGASVHKGLAAAAVDRNGLAALYFLDLSAVVAVEAKVLVLEAAKLSPFKQIQWVPDVSSTQLAGLAAMEAAPQAATSPGVGDTPPKETLEGPCGAKETLGDTVSPGVGRLSVASACSRWWADRGSGGRGPGGAQGRSWGSLSGGRPAGNFSCLVALEKKWGTLLFFYPRRTKVWWLLLPDFERLDGNREEVEAEDEFEKDSSKLAPWLRKGAVQGDDGGPEWQLQTLEKRERKTDSRETLLTRDAADQNAASEKISTVVSLAPPPASSSFLPLRVGCNPSLLLPSPAYPFYSPLFSVRSRRSSLANVLPGSLGRPDQTPGRLLAGAEASEAAAHEALSRALHALRVQGSSRLHDDSVLPAGSCQVREGKEQELDIAERAVRLAAAAETALDNVLMSILKLSPTCEDDSSLLGHHPLARELLESLNCMHSFGESSARSNAVASETGRAGGLGTTASECGRFFSRDKQGGETAEIDAGGTRCEWLTDSVSLLEKQRRLADQRRREKAPESELSEKRGRCLAEPRGVDLPAIYRERMRRSREVFCAMANARDCIWKTYAAAEESKQNP